MVRYQLGTEPLFFYFDGFEYGFYSTNKINKCLHEEAEKKHEGARANKEAS
jgi:hypothetical protein